MNLSVVICSHNPRADYLTRTLAAIRAQTLPTSEWELLLVDNASKDPLAGRFDLSWHPRGRHVAEPTLGLVSARLRGFAESTGEVLVFVDDDNLLDPDYLAQAVRIARDYPFVGAWGGQNRAEFEKPPEEWTRRYWVKLAIREFDHDQWSNLRQGNKTLPYGAGMCIRRRLVGVYAERCRADQYRRGLDRVGNRLTSAGDCDLALTACDEGLATGLFTALRLVHLMPAGRLEEEYLLRLEESIAFSTSVLYGLRGEQVVDTSRSLGQYAVDWIRYVAMNRRDYRFFAAERRGYRAAAQELAALKGRVTAGG